MNNYFNYRKLGENYLVTNDFGNYEFLSEKQFNDFICENLDPSDEKTISLKEGGFISDMSEEAFIRKWSEKYVVSKNYIFQSTSLFIFVVTTSCNLECIYCQARYTENNPLGTMDRTTARKAVDIALSSPGKYKTFEFQGGEPLINFDTIRAIVEYTEEAKEDKVINYTLVSNLTLITDEILDFCKKYRISVSTSLDGNMEVHDINRPMRSQKRESFYRVRESILKFRELGNEVGAIQTTTRHSLGNAEKIVEEYINLGLTSLFLRPLTPLGMAGRKWDQIGYEAEEFIHFYKEVLTLIIDKNLQGINIKEGHASIFLSKILGKNPVNYMELRSPCGATLGQMAFYPDGNIFTCDEGRMLHEMGDSSFKTGNVFDSSYSDLIRSDVTSAVCRSSITESLPGCCDCAYQPFCGTCPVINYSLEHDIISRKPQNFRCAVYKGMLDTIFGIIMNSDEKTLNMLKEW